MAIKCLSLRVFSCFLFLSPLLVPGNTQIVLPQITSGCIGNPGGTATFSTQMSLATGSLVVDAGDYWDQAGAVWIFSTSTDDVEFSQPGIPGYGAGLGDAVPSAAESAIALGSNGTAWTLSIPTSTLGGEWDIAFQAGPPPSTIYNNSSSLAHKTSSLSSDLRATNNTLPTVFQTPTPTSSANLTITVSHSIQDNPHSESTAVFKRYEPARSSRYGKKRVAGPVMTPNPSLIKRPHWPISIKPKRQIASGNFNLTIVGTWPCLGPPAPVLTSGNPQIASLCVENSISTVPASWTTYEAKSYISSLLAAAAPAPTDPQVNGVSLIHSDVNPAGPMCTFNAQCQAVSCSDVKDDATGTILSVQRFLAYNAVVNLNNYFYNLYDSLFNAGTLNGLLDDKIVTTYFTNPSPDATWKQVVNPSTSILGIFSAMLGLVAPGLSAGVGAIGGIASTISGAGAATELAPVVDQRFNESAGIEYWVALYLNSTIQAIGRAYDKILGDGASADLWAGSTLGTDYLSENGYFGEGIWVDSNYTQGLTDNLYNNLAKIFTYKVVNFAWNDSGVFIEYVPYNVPVADLHGNILNAGINEDWCQDNIVATEKNNIGSLMICDAPGPGMARIYNAGSSSGDLFSSSPDGWNSGVGSIDVAGAIRGSVNSFLVGDFGYDASNPYQSTLGAGQPLSAAQLSSLAAFDVSEETAGIFNLQVCEIFDLRYFNPTSGSNCNACSAAVGAKNKTERFWDYASQVVIGALTKIPTGISCGGYSGQSCSQQCPGTIFNGTDLGS